MLEKITREGKAYILAYDHGMEHGPIEFDDKNVDPAYIFDIALKTQATAVAVQKGIAEKYYLGEYRKVPLLIKLNGKDSLATGEPFSTQNCTVEEALQLGAAAVGYTIYLGSARDSEMMETFGGIVRQAHQSEIAAITWVYPRGKKVTDEDSPEITAYAARVALELGADMAKIKYCGSEECFAWAVKSAGRCKVVLSGGPKTKESIEFLETLKSVMKAGAIGVAVGRNVWQAKDPIAVANQIKEIVFG